jgi:hypothetical protein
VSDDREAEARSLFGLSPDFSDWEALASQLREALALGGDVGGLAEALDVDAYSLEADARELAGTADLGEIIRWTLERGDRARLVREVAAESERQGRAKAVAQLARPEAERLAREYGSLFRRALGEGGAPGE